MAGLRVLAIGDTHFRETYPEQGEELISKLLTITKKEVPDLIVLLGDVLHTFDQVHVTPYHQAHTLILRLAEISPIYVIIGNHDMINSSQYLSSNHFFKFLTHPKVTIVDHPIKRTIKGIPLVFTPYVPPGRFEEALDTLKSWKTAKCIFAHQDLVPPSKIERMPPKVGRMPPKVDVWSPTYPMVISGHIHTSSHTRNIYYPGSSVQVTFKETDPRYVWLVTFSDAPTVIKKIRVNTKSRIEKTLAPEDVRLEDLLKIAKHNYLKIKIMATPQQYKTFLKSNRSQELLSLGVTLARVNPPKTYAKEIINSESDTTTKKSLDKIFQTIVQTKEPEVIAAYKELYQPTKKSVIPKPL